MDADIGVLKMEPDMIMGPGVVPICLPASNIKTHSFNVEVINSFRKSKIAENQIVYQKHINFC